MKPWPPPAPALFSVFVRVGLIGGREFCFQHATTRLVKTKTPVAALLRPEGTSPLTVPKGHLPAQGGGRRVKRAVSQPRVRSRLRPYRPHLGGPNKEAKVLVHIAYSTKHHKRIAFQDEFRAICPQGMGSHPDERYAWD